MVSWWPNWRREGRMRREPGRKWYRLYSGWKMVSYTSSTYTISLSVQLFRVLVKRWKLAISIYNEYRIWNEFSFHTVFMKWVVCFISLSLWRGDIKHHKYHIKWKFISDSFYHITIRKNINISWKKYVFWENFARKSLWSVVLYVTS